MLTIQVKPRRISAFRPGNRAISTNPLPIENNLTAATSLRGGPLEVAVRWETATRMMETAVLGRSAGCNGSFAAAAWELASDWMTMMRKPVVRGQSEPTVVQLSASQSISKSRVNGSNPMQYVA